MEIIRESGHKSIQPTVAILGFFDGVHVGHRYVIRGMMDEAHRQGLKSMVITFDKHPSQVLSGNRNPELLTTLAEKLRLIEELHPDYCAVLNFNRQLAALSAFGFLDMLKSEYSVRVFCVGYDQRFGHNREHNFEEYQIYGASLGVDVVRSDEYRYESLRKVSSTDIRRLIKGGDVKQAQALLTYPYMLAGRVVKGFQNGKKIGFPTANIFLSDPYKILPPNGVYAVRVKLGNGIIYPGMLNIGIRPTFDNGSHRTIEVNIFDFNSNIYGCFVEILFYQKIRDEIKFDSLEKLKKQIATDSLTIRNLLN